MNPSSALPSPLARGDAGPPYWTWVEAEGPLLATAIHDGHDVHPDLVSRLRVTPPARRREEDHGCGWLAEFTAPRWIVHLSRFEVDLNRSREAALYRTREEAFGLDLWKEPLPAAIRQRSLRIHDLFYAELRRALDDRRRRCGRFVVLDLHSYNHRRTGPDAPPADPSRNPDVNLGTGSLDARWRPLAETVLDHFRQQRAGGRALTVGENVRFRGGYFPSWINRSYPEGGCALTLEFKKFYMDEWTGAVDVELLGGLRRALVELEPRLRAALERT